MRNDFALFNYLITFPESLHSGRVFNNDEIKKFCEEIGTFFAFIRHDKDNNEYIHFHIVLVLKVKMKKSKLMELFMTYFNLDSLDSFEFEKCSSVISSLRYLIHFDDLDKFQYLPFDVVTNNDYRFEEALTHTNDLDIDFLMSVCKKYRTCTGVMNIIGLERYKKYRNVIKDIIDELYLY